MGKWKFFKLQDKKDPTEADINSASVFFNIKNLIFFFLLIFISSIYLILNS